MPTTAPPLRLPHGATATACAIALVSLLAVAGCSDRQGADETAIATPPPSVVAVAAETRAIASQSAFVGRVIAIDKVELRARVQGFLKERSFTEGQTVEVGDLLFQIEPDQYQAIVEQRQADVAKAVADAENADAQFARGRDLVKSKNIAQSQVDELRAAASIAEAGIAQAKAALSAAELDLGYTRITAPIAGRIGLARYTVGNLVGPDSGALATIVSRDPIRVEFPLTQRELLEARRELQAKGLDPSGTVVKVRLPDDSLYDEIGRIDFVDVTTDPDTDSVTLRAVLPNPDGVLIDGQYVGVLLESGEPESAVVIPQSALQLDQQGVFVLIVDAERKARVRRVTVGTVEGAEIVVESGLETGELVITQGIQKVRPGQVVGATPPKPLAPPESKAGSAVRSGVDDAKATGQ
jgi:membrane fusion protein (multidrug efflux system)